MPSIDFAWIGQQMQSVNLATPTWDLFILLFFVVGTLVYGLTLGRERVVMLIVAIYMDLAVVTHAPYLRSFSASLNLGEGFALQITAFIGVFLILLFLLSKTALAHSFSLGDSGSWWQVLTFSALHVGLLTSVILSYLPPSALGSLTPVTREVFTSEQGRFVWIIVPILAMVVIHGEKKEKK